MSLYPGDTKTLTITYKVDDVLTDPDTVQITVKDPMGDTLITLAAATHDSTGHYHYDYTFLEDAITGEYTFTWTITIGTSVTTYSQLIELELPLVSTHYADADTIKVDLKQHSVQLAEDAYALVDVGIVRAEVIMNGKLGINESINQADVPAAQWNVLVQAATLIANACIMDSLYTQTEKRSPSAVFYENQANTILAPYLSG